MVDFVKLKERQKKSREEAYLLPDEKAENQIFDLIEYYDIDLSFEIPGLLDDDDFKKDFEQMTDDEKKGGIGVKQILKDVAHWIRLGVLSIEKTDMNDLVIKHALLSPIGEKSQDSKQMTDLLYQSVKPKHTEKMSGLKDDKYTFSQRAELLMALLAGFTNMNVFNKLSIHDKRAARDIGILLLTAL